MINLSVPNLSMDILENLKECLESGWVSTGGRFIPEFEEKVKVNIEDYYTILKDLIRENDIIGIRKTLANIIGTFKGRVE